MPTLLVGFDSAWTPGKHGAIVGTLRREDGTYWSLDIPRKARFGDALATIRNWQEEYQPTTTIVLLDQPTIVPNARGQRPVENIVSASVSRRYGGMQPANTSRLDMFGSQAPVWKFLNSCGGAADPRCSAFSTSVFEVYPVLAMIAPGWTIADSRPTGRLPKYNPERRKTFKIADWRHVCQNTATYFVEREITNIAEWIDTLSRKTPSKHDQDCLDACLCLLVGLHMAEGKDCLVIGDFQTGYIVAPHGAGGVELCAELHARCTKTGRDPSAWARVLAFQASSEELVAIEPTIPESR